MWTTRPSQFNSSTVPGRSGATPPICDFVPVFRVSQFVEIARPKINLTLQVLGKLPDGYHALASLVAFADGPADRVTLDCASPRGLTVTGPFADDIHGNNLLETVLERVTEAAHVATGDSGKFQTGHVYLEKCLPVAAGIGGGSADAAALLRALRAANRDLAAVIDWNAIALRLGADVPVCLLNRAAFMTGIGEHLTPIANFPRLPVVLVNPLTTVPTDKTARVFRTLAAKPLPASGIDPQAPASLTREMLIGLIDGGNDLEPAACRVVPEIVDVLDQLRSTSQCRVAAMSGAGPTCFAVFDDEAATIEAVEHLRMRRPQWWISAAVLAHV